MLLEFCNSFSRTGSKIFFSSFLLNVSCSGRQGGELLFSYLVNLIVCIKAYVDFKLCKNLSSETTEYGGNL